MSNFYVTLRQSRSIGLLEGEASRLTRSAAEILSPALFLRFWVFGAQHMTETANRVGQTTYQGATPLQCLMCGGFRYRPIFNEGGIDILRCRECHHVFSSFPADAHYDGFWGEEVAEGDHAYWKTARTRMYQDFIKGFLVGRSG